MKPALWNVYTVKRPEGEFNVISFLPAEHSFEKGIPDEAIVGVLPKGVTEIRHKDFRPNAAFRKFLHQVIAKHGAHAPGIQEEARRLGDGYVYIIDGRLPDPDGAVEPEDIIGAFQAKGGKVVEGSYQASERHLLVSKRGLLVLDVWLHERLMEELSRLNVPERGG
jgi:hypothetical protein